MAYYSAQATLTSASLSHLPAATYRAEGLDQLFKKFMFQDACVPDTIAKRSGSTVQWFRYGVMTSNTTARTTAGGPGTATEGQIGSGSTLSSATVSATISQYTDYIAISDFARDVHIDDTLVAASRNLGYRAGLSTDNITRAEIDSASGAEIAPISGTHGTFSAKDAAQAFFALQAQDVEPMDSGKCAGFMYGVMHSYVAYDFMNDPTVGGYQDLLKYSRPETYTGKFEDRGFLATVNGVKFYTSTNVKVTAGSPNYYRVYVFGKGGVGMVDLAGKGPTRTNDVKSKPFKINVISGGPDKADPEGVIGGIASYNFSYATKILQTSPYRFRWFDASSTIG